MPSRSSLSADERRLRSRLHALLTRADGFLHGSPTVLMRKCGKPNCGCATDDSKRHRSFSVGQTRGGKTTTVHVPKEMESEVRAWIDNFNTALDLFEALSGQSRERIRRRKQKRPTGKTGSVRRKTPNRNSPSSGES
jgi:hypothetical protein